MVSADVTGGNRDEERLPCPNASFLQGLHNFRVERTGGFSMKDSPHFKQAQLMLRVMPHVAAEE